jgi:hypothetical protein
VPRVDDRGLKSVNAIDAFIRVRLQSEKITPSPEAGPETLIRRLSLDLLGVPPTPTEVDAFLSAWPVGSDTAYLGLVDRVLADPRYGERWGRHWLDTARYADSDGFEKDTGRPWAWRWRTWVIDALNRDLPFDQFAIEQLAGDLLPGANVEQKIATGFHRNTLTNREGGVDREQFRVEQVVDRVATTSKVFLGLTMNCCQCHDHKYDPLSQRDFYQFFAFFNSDAEVDLPVPLPGEADEYKKKKADFDKKAAELKAVLEAYTKDELPAEQAKWEADLTPEAVKPLPPGVQAALKVASKDRTAPQQKMIADHFAKIDKKLIELNKVLADHQKTQPQQSLAQTLGLGAARKTTVMIRGDFLRPGAEVKAETPAVLPSLSVNTTAANRLDLAHWIVSDENPLTRRVIVNWVWHHHFGRGLVSTLEDFGTQGEKPSHPELLDYLADEFQRQGWSLKALHRLIVTSATYRQSAKTRPELRERDAINVLLARQNRLRLEAEAIRDNALAVSGLLAVKIGGPSVRPPQPAGISELTYAGSAKWVESTGADRYRRGLYTWFQRTSPYPMLMTFDAPDSNVCSVRRERTNTPLQALTLMNDTVFVECAQALGRRIVNDLPTASVGDRVRYGFRLCLSRSPTDNESAVLTKLFETLHENCRRNPEAASKLLGAAKASGDPAETAAWVALARTLMNLDEFVTRE